MLYGLIMVTCLWILTTTFLLKLGYEMTKVHAQTKDKLRKANLYIQKADTTIYTLNEDLKVALNEISELKDETEKAKLQAVETSIEAQKSVIKNQKKDK